MQTRAEKRTVTTSTQMIVLDDCWISCFFYV